MTSAPSNHQETPAADVLPGQWLGMLGGGQLGRMFCHAAQQMGYKVAVLDPDAESPAGRVADWHLCADYLDSHALEQLAQRCKAVSIEFENIPADTLERLAQDVIVRPHAAAVEIIQDRIREKAFFTDAGVDVVPYLPIRTAAALEQCDAAYFPAILKAARFGYDGKGQARVANRQEALSAFREFGEVDCVLEREVDLVSEASVILVRSCEGDVIFYPAVENRHTSGILSVSVSDAFAQRPELERQAQEAAGAIANKLNYTGVLCVEFFVLQDGRLLANEMAPRPHNSGHYTLDACEESQFSQQVRALAGLPLGSGQNKQAAVMLNLLGDVWFPDPRSKQVVTPAWEQLLAIPGVHLYLYGKTEVRRGRKMGHVNVVAETADLAYERASTVANILHLSI